jgi:HK97 family phage major capsid protein/HK97 family phage prohead protease
MDREYARLDGTQLEIKTVNVSARTFSGMATTPDLDRQGHSVDPAGVTFQNPIKLLFQHDQNLPIGFVTLGAATASGIPFTAQLATIDEPGPLRDRIRDAWQLITSGLISAVSIGYRVLDNAIRPIKGGGFRLLKTEVVELSLVTIPANPYASILLVKSLAATGPSPSGASAGPRAIGKPMTLAEQIRSYESTRAAKAADMVSLMTAATDRGTTLEPSDMDRYDTLDTEVKSFDDTIARLKRAEQLQLTQLTPVPATPAAGRLPVVSVKSNLPPGTAFVRGALALLRANGNRYEAVEHAKQWADSTPEVALWLKAAVAPGNTTDPAWAGVLAQAANVTAEFVALLRPATVLGKIPNLKNVPFNVSVPIQTLGGIYGWTGQGAPKKVTKLGFGTDKLGMTKATGIIVLTEELVRSSDPSAEAICRADMIAGIAQFLDQQFLDPLVAEVVNVNPASITNGTTPIASSGSALADIHALIASLAAANIPLGGVTLVMSETNAFTLGMVRDPQGNRLFPSMSAGGGSVDGINVVTSNVAGTNVIALQPQYVLYADSGGVEIDLSREASLQLDDAPMNPADATTVFTSLWQNNLVGLRAERFVNWKRAKLEAVKYVSGATYAPTYIAPGGGAGALAGGGSTRSANAKQA